MPMQALWKNRLLGLLLNRLHLKLADHGRDKRTALVSMNFLTAFPIGAF
jgi:hypothetical protein